MYLSDRLDIFKWVILFNLLKIDQKRVRNHMLKDKSVEIQEEAAEYLTFIDRKRQNRQSRITAVNDQQQVIFNKKCDTVLFVCFEPWNWWKYL